MRQIKAAAIQMKCDLEHKKNLQKAEQMIRKAAAEGANIILLPELLSGNISASSADMILQLCKNCGGE